MLTGGLGGGGGGGGGTGGLIILDHVRFLFGCGLGSGEGVGEGLVERCWTR